MNERITTERILICPYCGKELDEGDVSQNEECVFCPTCEDFVDLREAIADFLKPCPFCGEEVEWREDKEDIYCPCCEASWHSIHYLENNTKNTWNRRVTDGE